MRLLKYRSDSDDFILEEYVGNSIPPYAILSHTWGPDNDEVTFKDVTESRGKDKPGYRKLKFCSNQAARDHLDFFWVDTCCIDKTSSAELTEAINSMFKWYRGAKKCYVLLSDVSISSPVTEITQEKWAEVFQSSRWFKRGWTLQELLAPQSVEFFSKAEDKIGDKKSLQDALHITTGLPIPALKNSTLSQFSVDERFSWAGRRETKREEDAAYSLLGIFDTQISLIYGEGRERAFIRLRREIEGSLGAQTQLANSQRVWTVPFGRDPDFVNRESLDRVHQICNQPAGRASLVGLGGIGSVTEHGVCRKLLTVGTGSPRLPLNTLTVQGIGLPQNGFSGYTQEPRRDLKQDIAGSLKQQRWMDGMTPKPTFCGSYAAGCAMIRTDDGP
jgi:hypothetical protein